jgi:hypothetical protein
MNRLSFVGMALIVSLASWSLAAANEAWQPPVSPDLYDRPSGVGQPPKFDSGFYVGGLGSFGQSLSTGPGSPLPSYRLSLDLGYTFSGSSWSRWEAGVETFFGRVGTSDVEIPIGVGFLAKIGHGYSLGNKLVGIWKLGVGPTLGRYEEELDDGATAKSLDSVWGTALQASYWLLFPASNSFAVIGGISWTHYAFNIDERERKTRDGTVARDPKNIAVNLNVPEASIGIRFIL